MKTKKRTKGFRVVLSKEEHRQLEVVALHNGWSMATTVRSLIREAHQRVMGLR